MTKESNRKAVSKYQQKIVDGVKISRIKWLKFKYGITQEDYNNMLLGQNGLCAICNLSMEDKDICIDHCHKTNKVRGLLHRTCNAAIGLLKEDVNILANAINYINKN